MSKALIPFHLSLRALLAIRANELDDAEKCINSVQGYNSSLHQFTIFLLGLIKHGQGNDAEAVGLLGSLCYGDRLNKQALYFLSSMSTLDEHTAIFFRTVNVPLASLHPSNSRISLDLFTASCLAEVSFSDALMAFCSSEFLRDMEYSVIHSYDLQVNQSLSKLKETFRVACASALSRFCNLFDVSVDKVPHDDRAANIVNCSSIQNPRRRRVSVRIKGKSANSLPQKALQMLSKPDCWMLSQDHMVPLLSAEIARIRSLKRRNLVNLHEIGPGCGYLLHIISSVNFVSCTASDCYDSDSFSSILRVGENPGLIDFASGSHSKLLSYEKLDLLCYWLANTECCQDRVVSNFPVSSSSFPESLLSSEIVYSHLPALDLYDANGLRSEAWDEYKWYDFFENIFTHPDSRVQTVLMARNWHSVGLERMENMLSFRPPKCWRASFLRGNFCAGLVVVARRL
ncbi:hypothetical protein [Synechococcus sp. MU1648]|uniref:hypothetical protein n=1 Tax=Synechococcus sp. MU1648 TaxID=2508351 RepID=UPI00202636C8|nr:hypothetical protein [Synechococcus sp. MU1648]